MLLTKLNYVIVTLFRLLTFTIACLVPMLVIATGITGLLHISTVQALHYSFVQGFFVLGRVSISTLQVRGYYF